MLIRVTALAVLMFGGSRYGPPLHRASTDAAVELTDARILGTLGAADADQLEAAKLAVTKASSKGVRDYAKMLVHDHHETFEENTKLAKRFRLNRLQPEDSAMARAHKQAMTELNLLSDAAFDLAFLRTMVADHAALITDVNTKLLPAAQRTAVKAFVRKLLPLLTGHRLMAQALLDKQK